MDFLFLSRKLIIVNHKNIKVQQSSYITSHIQYVVNDRICGFGFAKTRRFYIYIYIYKAHLITSKLSLLYFKMHKHPQTYRKINSFRDQPAEWIHLFSLFSLSLCWCKIIERKTRFPLFLSGCGRKWEITNDVFMYIMLAVVKGKYHSVCLLSLQ